MNNKQSIFATLSDSDTSDDDSITLNELNDTWILWAHMPHDTDWTIKSYKKIFSFNTIEEAIGITKILPDHMIQNCMLFLMRDGILPTWEDKHNRNGGCFSYKISNNFVPETWRNLTYTIAGETLFKSIKTCKDITGISVSPKKNFCVFKIWLSTCKHKSPSVISTVEPGLTHHGCIFKRNNPDY